MQPGSNRVTVQKTTFLRDQPDEEEVSSFKPPVFLIAIGLAILYQVFFGRHRSKDGTKLSKSSKQKAIGKSIDQISKMAQRFNK